MQTLKEGESPFAPLALRKEIAKVLPRFAGRAQRDAHDFILSITDACNISGFMVSVVNSMTGKCCGHCSKKSEEGLGLQVAVPSGVDPLYLQIIM